MLPIPVITSGMPFVILMVLGVLGLQTGYTVLALRNRRRGAAVLFIITALLQLCMGYLSSRDFTKASMNWIGEIVNAAGMVCLLLGVMDLKKNVYTD